MRAFFAIVLGGGAALAVACGIALDGTGPRQTHDASTIDADDDVHTDAPLDAAPTDGCDDAACGSAIVQLVGAGTHFCARTRAGAVYCWGSNGQGELGVGDTTSHPHPTRVQLPDAGGFAEIATGLQHTCARGDDDAVYCWGLNQFGQIGAVLATASRATPTRVGLLFAGAIATGGEHSCAIDHALRVVCWGMNQGGELGYEPGTRTDAGEARCGTVWCNPNATPASIATAARLDLLFAASCAVDGDGGVACWGSNSNGTVGGPGAGGPDAARIDFSDAGAAIRAEQVVGTFLSACALGSGDARCWGYNSWGNLGRTTPGNVWPPAPFASVSGITAAAAGVAHTCVVASGRVLCAGWNGEGELGGGALGGDAGCPIFRAGQPPNQCASGIVDVGLANIVDVAVTTTSTCARAADGRILCWGENDQGQLGHPPGMNGDVTCYGATTCNAYPTEVAFPP